MSQQDMFQSYIYRIVWYCLLNNQNLYDFGKIAVNADFIIVQMATRLRWRSLCLCLYALTERAGQNFRKR